MEFHDCLDSVCSPFTSCFDGVNSSTSLHLSFCVCHVDRMILSNVTLWRLNEILYMELLI